MKIRTLDYHAAGEPLRIVTAGLPAIEGESMLARRRFMRERLDQFRRLLMLEPRGHADMYGAVLTPPATDDGDFGVLFLHNEGYSTMCGHGIIALVTAGIEHGLFEVRDPENIRIDTPAGRVSARAVQGTGGRVELVSFVNVPSFVLRDGVNLRLAERTLSATIAFGGAFYAYVDARDLGFQIVPAEAAQLIQAGPLAQRLHLRGWGTRSLPHRHRCQRARRYPLCPRRDQPGRDADHREHPRNRVPGTVPAENLGRWVGRSDNRSQRQRLDVRGARVRARSPGPLA